ncbi:MarR family winged helix-turn-helix transcriptional regulator [Acetobacterium wieringae]|uniref:MarR family winged helix-turn-helix transcriptional regulator n=1 Tax=Acetobacterium wieringae TaxID=52694 RepID=UPI0026EB2BB8|nr:MarR family transcriptional regulator [Acetobacterium wieringae]
MLMNNLSIIVRHSKLFCERRLHDSGVGFPEQVILMYLASNTEVNQDAIAQHFMLDKGAIAKTLRKLEDKSLIERHQNPENKRENLISIASAGQNILGKMEAALNEWNQSFFEGISDEEIEHYSKITKKIADNVARLNETGAADHQ